MGLFRKFDPTTHDVFFFPGKEFQLRDGVKVIGNGRVTLIDLENAKSDAIENLNKWLCYELNIHQLCNQPYRYLR